MKSYLHWLIGSLFHWLLAALILFQCFLFCVLFFGDIGFDHPGKYGLDYDDFVHIQVAYPVALLLGIGLAIALKEWRLLEVQLAIPLVAIIGSNVYQAWRRQPLDPADYQHLVGMTKAEVRAEEWHVVLA